MIEGGWKVGVDDCEDEDDLELVGEGLGDVVVDLVAEGCLERVGEGETEDVGELVFELDRVSVGERVPVLVGVGV